MMDQNDHNQMNISQPVIQLVDEGKQEMVEIVCASVSVSHFTRLITWLPSYFN